MCSVRLTRPRSRAQPSAASMSALPIPRLAARSATASSPMYPSRSPVKCRLGLTLMTPAIASPSAATRTVPSPAAAAASESASHRRPAVRAAAWSRHGATPSASLGASARMASLSLSDAGRMLMPELSILATLARRPASIKAPTPPLWSRTLRFSCCYQRPGVVFCSKVSNRVSRREMPGRRPTDVGRVRRVLGCHGTGVGAGLPRDLGRGYHGTWVPSQERNWPVGPSSGRSAR